jgi:hypothetical protein
VQQQDATTGIHESPSSWLTQICHVVLQLEGTCSPKHGYILAVLRVDDISKVSIWC